MTAKKRSRQQRQRLADPVTYAAEEAAMAEGKARFGPPMNAALAQINALVAGRKLAELSSAETVQFMALRAKFDSLSIQEKHFVEAALAERLGPRDGSEMADA